MNQRYRMECNSCGWVGTSDEVLNFLDEETTGYSYFRSDNLSCPYCSDSELSHYPDELIYFRQE